MSLEPWGPLINCLVSIYNQDKIILLLKQIHVIAEYILVKNFLFLKINLNESYLTLKIRAY